VPFCEIKWKKDGTAEQATDDNTAHALCMLDTYGYKHTHRTCHIYWFSKEIIVSRSASVLRHVSIAFLVPINPLKPELNPICYLLALLAHHFLHVSRIRVKSLTIRLLMSYIYGAPILDVSRSHTTTQHSR